MCVGAGVTLCAFCDFEAMEAACLTAPGRRSLLRSLKAMANPNFRTIALEQIPAEYQGHFSRGLASAQFCAGFEGEACVFALAKSGGPAQVHQRQARSCLFCDPVAVGSKVDAPGGLKDIAAALKKMSEAARARALTERIPEDVRARAQALLIPKEPRRPRLGAPPELGELQRRWAPALAERQSPKAPATAAQKKAYRERVLADKARGRKHAGRPKERTVPGAAVDNSAPAPPAKRSAKAAGLERWALHYSWAQCEACGAMLARDLTQKSLNRDQKVTAPSLQCPRCRGARGHPAPKLADDDEMRRKTKVAYDYLRQAEDSAYGKFLREHKSFLEEHPAALRPARPDDDESGDEGEAEDSDLVRHSIKRLYAALSLGDTAPRKDWQDHVFAVRDETGQGRRLHGFVRIEFQDGTRKLPTQEYHGSGRPHLHLLVFGDDDLIRTLDLSSAASATMPSDTDLAGYVRGSQLDHKQDSGRGIFAEENQYVEELNAWRLKHLAEDQEWLNDDADAVSIATTVLSKRDFVVPVPDAELPEKHEVRLYEAAAWARGRVSLLDFLRKTNADGQISAWLKKKHAAQGEPDETLEDFTIRYKVQGEKVVAAECVSRLSDRHYGQWLTLHKPFRRCLDLVDEAQLAKVPPQYRYLAMAHLNGYGADDAEVDRELKVEGHSRAASQSIKDMLAANLALIQDYLAGRIQERFEPAAAVPEGRAGQEAVAYNSQQRRFKTFLDAAVGRALLARSADEGEAEAAAAEARASGKAGLGFAAAGQRCGRCREEE
ncbi:unnamed protein product, partial [Effrenium voratum]